MRLAASTYSISSRGPKKTYERELRECGAASSAGGQWGPEQINGMVDSMHVDFLKLACQTVKLPADKVNYSSDYAMRHALLNDMNSWTGSWIFADGPSNIYYHRDIVVPTARKVGIPVSRNASTYHVESAVYRHLLKKQWDPMTEDQRVVFLRAAGWNLSERRVLALAAVSGAGLVALLGTWVGVAGFSFYIGMSSGLAALAGLLDITLPFAAYTAASTAVALATAPVALAIAAIVGVFGVYEWITAGGAEADANRLRLVVHLHNLRVAAMKQASIPLPVRA
jgi:hypothetical protein